MLKMNRPDAEQSVLSAVAGHVFQMFPIKKAAESHGQRLTLHPGRKIK